MNVPERSDSYVLSPGESKVAYSADTKTENTATFTFNKEDHTLGNLLRMQLLRDKEIRFAGYIMPHPLINRLDLKLMTKETLPQNQLVYALDDLISETQDIDKKFNEAVQSMKERDTR